jgi:hypothetical protein
LGKTGVEHRSAVFPDALHWRGVQRRRRFAGSSDNT